MKTRECDEDLRQSPGPAGFRTPFGLGGAVMPGATALAGVAALAGFAILPRAGMSVGAQSPGEQSMSYGAAVGADVAAVQDTPLVALETSMGTIVLELYPWKAPVSVENFLSYVEPGFYDGLIFHRVIPGFMIQGGGFTSSMRKLSTLPPIVNESDNGLSNKRGTVAMARRPDPNSARSQFFINLADNRNLDFKGPSGGWGYAVFGSVRDGMDVVDAIAQVETGAAAGMSDVPLVPVVIRSATLLED